MGKAHRAPMDTYSQRLNITEHSVQRFRERAKTFLEREGHLSEEAVTLQLDYWVSEALAQGANESGIVFEMFDEGRTSKLVHLVHPDWESLWALVRENGDRRFAFAQWAVITLLTDWMVCESTVSGRYTGNLPRIPQFAKHYETMREPKKLEVKPAVVVRRASVPELKAVVVPETTPAAEVVDTVTPAPAAETATATMANNLVVAARELRLVVYEDSNGKHHEELALSMVAARVEELLDRGVRKDVIRVWRPAAVKTRVEVE